MVAAIESRRVVGVGDRVWFMGASSDMSAHELAQRAGVGLGIIESDLPGGWSARSSIRMNAGLAIRMWIWFAVWGMLSEANFFQLRGVG